jgi:LPXTG-motif cell wall-anchored protein
MSNQRSRTDIAAWTAIAIGLIIGLFLKRVRYGLIIGLVLGMVAVFLFWRKRKN